jgi:DHA1 family bicyclomycin/chloramphenicol resistance-like MFS transporter
LATLAAPPASRLHHLELLILLGLLQAIAPVSIDMYLAALPAMETVFGATAAAVRSTMVTFMIGFALGQAAYGPITDRFGRKPPLYFSLALFAASSAACAFAPSIPAMAALRFLQAVGACGGAVMSRAIVRDLFPPEQLRRIFSMLILVLGVSPVIAPLIGSYLLLWFGWRSPFLAQAAIGAACLAGMHFRLRESLAPARRRSLEWNVIWEGYSRLLKDRIFVSSSVVCGFSAAGAFAYISAAPFLFISFYSVPTERFGWLFGFIAAGMIVASQINGRMPQRIPLWLVLRIANLVQLAAAALLVGFVLTGFGGLATVYGCIFVYVAAQGFVFPNGSAIAMTRHPEIAGTASALLGTNQFFIAAIATILLGMLDSPAVPLAFVMAGCALASNALNLAALGPKLDQRQPSRASSN